MASSRREIHLGSKPDSAPAPPPSRRARAPRRFHEVVRQGIPAIWSSGLAVLCVLLMLGGMMALVLTKGLRHFWPARCVQLETASGVFLGPEVQREPAGGPAGAGRGARVLLRIGNRDLYGLDFRWFDLADVLRRTTPRDAVVLERREYGDFHGYLLEVRHDEQEVVRGPDAWEALEHDIPAARTLERRLKSLPALDSRRAESLRDLDSWEVVLRSADGREKTVRLAEIVRAYRPNAMHTGQRLQLYVSKLREFICEAPRESNTEGGVYPALFGTVLMVLLMTVAVVPLGVVAALYLHEYARPGIVLRCVRLAVGNLAGVPSIVFGMFGLAFFVYGLGGGIDRTFFARSLPNPTFGTGGILWASLTLALLTLPVVIVATEEGLTAVPRANREAALALGATQWQTLRHIVVPNAMPGILTGMILAVSRGAGEVAPLMITGVVKLAPALPLDGSLPFLHFERKFMHLGFHIYDVSMQSPNVEAAKPMVYSTTLLLLLLVVTLNATAILVRNRMRRRYRGAAV